MGLRFSFCQRVCYRGLTLLLPVLGLTGCASYYTHYALFPAANSAGESRQVRVSWQSADYPDWWIVSDKATTMKVETQCSERVWRLTDSSHEHAGDCGQGIHACGDPEQDLLLASGRPATPGDACMSVGLPDADARVAEVGASFALLVSCQPARTVVNRSDEAVNMDYLRASSVAYTVHARKVPRGSLNARLPEFDESQCQQD